jgi:UDP-GlcNAc:undecaprenyl-phosphate GlcNAc-1-phosphate transferase
MLELELFVVFVTAMICTLSAIPVVLRMADGYGLYDLPDSIPGSESESGRKVHSRPIPRLGGIGIVLGFFFSSVLWLSPTPLRSILIGSLLFFFVGVIDDLRTLSAKKRLMLQLLGAIFVVVSARIYIQEVYLTPQFKLNLGQPFSLILPVFIIMGAVNAINLADGLDGLAGGLVLIGIALLSMLQFVASDDIQLLLYISVPIIGSLLGFLKYNTHPATIFMGDGGSNWLGFMLGLFAVLLLCGATLGDVSNGLKFGQSKVPIPIVSVLMCLAVPIVDTLTVIILRLLKGRSPMSADRNHFHHSLMKVGFSHPQSVSLIYFIAVLMGVSGIIPAAHPNKALWWAPYLAVCLLFFVIILSLKVENAKSIALLRKAAGLRLGITSHRSFHHYIYGFEIIIRYGIYCILAIAPLISGVPPKSLGYSSLMALFLLGFSFFLRESGNFFQSFLLAISASIVLTAINFNTLSISLMGNIYNVQFVYNYAFICLLLVTVIYMIISLRKQELVVTPTDFLMLFLPFLYLMVPEPYRSDYRLNIISLRSLVLFLAIRVITKRQEAILWRIRTVTFFALVYIVFVALLDLKFVY